MPVTTICLFSSNFLLILKCYNNVFPVCHIFKHTLDYFLCILVGYIADFICYVANDVVQIQMNLPLRILALLLAQLMASMGVALYMVADMGIAPYDSVATIIEKLTHQKIPFHKCKDYNSPILARLISRTDTGLSFSSSSFIQTFTLNNEPFSLVKRCRTDFADIQNKKNVEVTDNGKIII